MLGRPVFSAAEIRRRKVELKKIVLGGLAPRPRRTPPAPRRIR
jgi:hypothetical protein